MSSSPWIYTLHKILRVYFYEAAASSFDERHGNFQRTLTKITDPEHSYYNYNTQQFADHIQFILNVINSVSVPGVGGGGEEERNRKRVFRVNVIALKTISSNMDIVMKEPSVCRSETLDENLVKAASVFRRLTRWLREIQAKKKSSRYTLPPLDTSSSAKRSTTLDVDDLFQFHLTLKQLHLNISSMGK